LHSHSQQNQQDVSQHCSLEIREAPYTNPPADSIVIRNHAIAINPIDFKLQDKALFPFLSYPAILGMDIAGEVVQVGSQASSVFKPFKLGDRVLAQAGGISANESSAAAFQKYTVVLAKMASHIPDSLSYTDAAVIPLGAATAACGLFQKDHLSLQLPMLVPRHKEQTLLVWGGASSVGINAIQLAVAAGYTVMATASPKNFELLRHLGATQVIDYNQDSAALLEQLVAAFKDTPIAGVLHTAGDAKAPIAICAELFPHVQGNKFFSTTMPLPSEIPTDFEHKRIFASAIEKSEVAEAIFNIFLPAALATDKYKAAPRAKVVGTGLESLQKGLDLLRMGVSAKKLVVTLD
jgi:NADPH:quinone reductase-like Zn-dependent oxidoreductase